MTSATPIAPNSIIKSRTSLTVNAAPADANGDSGTHDDAATPKVNGKCSAASMSARIPSMPATLAISCGSAATAVVPHGNTALTYSLTHIFDDSKCICASTKPGTKAAPSTSMTSSASRCPHPAITPSAIARSVVTHSLVAGDNTRPPLSKISAGSSPRATARARKLAGGLAITSS